VWCDVYAKLFSIQMRVDAWHQVPLAFALAGEQSHLTEVDLAAWADGLLWVDLLAERGLWGQSLVVGVRGSELSDARSSHGGDVKHWDYGEGQ
jgi:hypothetical protein